MDVVSVTIVVVVLSFGSILVYLSNLDFERRRKSSVIQAHPGNTNSNNNSKRALKQNNNALNLASKQQQQHHVKSDNLVPRELSLNLKQSNNKLTQQSIDRNNDNVDANGGNNYKVPLGLGTFETNVKTINSKQQQTATKQANQSTRCKQTRVENDPTVVVGPMKPEQLFALMTASSLDRDEVELAIETLLNKLESGDSNWKQAKSDPLYRLKARLRDQEAALATEIANHQTTRVKLESIDSSLGQARCELSKQQLVQKRLMDENSRLLGELGKIRADLSQQHQMHKQFETETLKQLELARCELKEHQMTQKQLQVDRLHEIDRLEQDKAQLQAMLLELQLINSGQEEMLRRQSDERVQDEALMRKTLLEMEYELKELQKKLSANSANQDEKIRKAMRELSNSNNNQKERNRNNSKVDAGKLKWPEMERKFLGVR